MCTYILVCVLLCTQYVCGISSVKGSSSLSCTYNHAPMLSVLFSCFAIAHAEEGVVPEVREEEPEENYGSTSLIVNAPPQPPKDFSECHI